MNTDNLMRAVRQRLESAPDFDAVLLRMPEQAGAEAQWTPAEESLQQAQPNEVHLVTFSEDVVVKTRSIPFTSTVNVVVVDCDMVVRWHSDSLTGLFSGQSSDFTQVFSDALEFTHNLECSQ
jgi:hypothetical protein